MRTVGAPNDHAKKRPNIEFTSSINRSPSGGKRKAEDVLTAPSDKMRKSGSANVQINRIQQPIGLQTSSPDRTSRSSLPLCPRLESASHTAAKVAAGPTAPQISTNVADGAAKGPKKGSYAEIMARAKATQSKPPAIGVISHKPKEQKTVSYKKELKMKHKILKNKKLDVKEDVRPSSSGSMSSSPAPGQPDMKKGVQPSYKGTAKPKVLPTYKGTMKPGASIDQKAKAKDRVGDTPKVRYDEYAATDEDDLDDVEEDDYGSEESDNMEAGFSDVEQEESAAARAARKEDEEEAKLEATLKKEKEDRKRRLELMAKKAKPQRY